MVHQPPRLLPKHPQETPSPLAAQILEMYLCVCQDAVHALKDRTFNAFHDVDEFPLFFRVDKPRRTKSAAGKRPELLQPWDCSVISHMGSAMMRTLFGVDANPTCVYTGGQVACLPDTPAPSHKCTSQQRVANHDLQDICVSTKCRGSAWRRLLSGKQRSGCERQQKKKKSTVEKIFTKVITEKNGSLAEPQRNDSL